jgi:tetratricopeptide (TPR) repeat protein
MTCEGVIDVRPCRTRLVIVLSLLFVVLSGTIASPHVKAQLQNQLEIKPGETHGFSQEIDAGVAIRFSVLVDAAGTYQIQVRILDWNDYLTHFDDTETVIYDAMIRSGVPTTYEAHAPYQGEWVVFFTNTDNDESAYINGTVTFGSNVTAVNAYVSNENPFLGVTVGVSLIAAAAGILVFHRRRRRSIGIKEKELLEKGIDLLSSGEYGDAETAFKTIIEENSKSAVGWRYLGDTLVLRGNMPEARLAHQRAVRLKPEYESRTTIESKERVAGSPWVESSTRMDLTMQVQSLTAPMHFQDSSASLQLLEQLLREQEEKLHNNPEDLTLKSETATTLLRLGRSSKAAKLFGEILVKLPEDWDTHNSLLMALGDAKFR